MVEFISSNSGLREEVDDPQLEEPPPKSLEVLVEESAEELRSLESAQDYIDELSFISPEYSAPEHITLRDAPSLKHELRPLIYEENDAVIVVDIFERYGQKEDKWWKEKNSF
jgi:hypothetical protein